jgi:hypothetical protein
VTIYDREVSLPPEPPWDSVVRDRDGDTWVRTPYGWWLVLPGTHEYEDCAALVTDRGSLRRRLPSRLP